jgi:hypothetical protein
MLRNKHKSIFDLNSIWILVFSFLLNSCIIQYPHVNNAKSTLGTVSGYTSGKSGRG